MFFRAATPTRFCIRSILDRSFFVPAKNAWIAQRSSSAPQRYAFVHCRRIRRIKISGFVFSRSLRVLKTRTELDPSSLRVCFVSDSPRSLVRDARSSRAAGIIFRRIHVYARSVGRSVGWFLCRVYASSIIPSLPTLRGSWLVTRYSRDLVISSSEFARYEPQPWSRSPRR